MYSYIFVYSSYIGSDKLFGDVIQSIRTPSLNPDATPYRADNSGKIYIYIYTYICIYSHHHTLCIICFIENSLVLLVGIAPGPTSIHRGKINLCESLRSIPVVVCKLTIDRSNKSCVSLRFFSCECVKLRSLWNLTSAVSVCCYFCMINVYANYLFAIFMSHLF
jgi:hypothetical protein